jgi:DNA adenine methylase
MIKTMLRYPGGKSRAGVRDKILSRFPVFTSYREIFVGGGGIYFALPTMPSRWINDINPGLISLYLALRDRTDSFIKSCEEIEPAKDGEPLAPAKGGKALYNGRLKGVFDKFKDDEEMDQALRYLFVNRTVWGGRVVYEDESRMYFSNPQGWSFSLFRRLKEASKHLSGTQITCGDYSALLEAPGDDVLIYADPPYVVNTELVDGSRLYADNFTMDDHRLFAERVKRCPHKVCISYDDDEGGLIRNLYPEADGFNVYEESWTYAGSSRDVKVKGKELIITNYGGDF